MTKTKKITFTYLKFFGMALFRDWKDLGVPKSKDVWLCNYCHRPVRLIRKDNEMHYWCKHCMKFFDWKKIE